MLTQLWSNYEWTIPHLNSHLYPLNNKFKMNNWLKLGISSPWTKSTWKLCNGWSIASPLKHLQSWARNSQELMILHFLMEVLNMFLNLPGNQSIFPGETTIHLAFLSIQHTAFGAHNIASSTLKKIIADFWQQLDSVYRTDPGFLVTFCTVTTHLRTNNSSSVWACCSLQESKSNLTT